MTRKKQTDLTALFLLLTLVISVILYVNLKKQKSILDRQLIPIKSAWESILTERRLEEEVGLTFVRSSRIFSRRADQFLYPRRYKVEALSRRVSQLLGDYGIGIERISVEETSGDVTFVLGSAGISVTELICTPDMSTYAGKICLIIDDFGLLARLCITLQDSSVDLLQLLDLDEVCPEDHGHHLGAVARRITDVFHITNDEIHFSALHRLLESASAQRS